MKAAKNTCALPKSAFPLKFKVKSPSHALELARKLIQPFKHWVVGELAVGVDEEGYKDVIGVKSPRAEAFCALGALQRVNTKHYSTAVVFLRKAARQIAPPDERADRLSNDDIFVVNDRAHSKKNHDTVLQMFSEAIMLARKAERESKQRSR